MTNLLIDQFICRQDNFGVLAHDPESGHTVSIDAPDAPTIIAHCQKAGWKLTHLLITHHHPDHVEGIPALKEAFDPLVIGPAPEASRISGLDLGYTDGESFDFAGREVVVIHTPGHTLGHVNFHFPEDKLLFSGDTLFALGCGRLFEGTPADMHASLMKLAALPDDTTVYCGHEYTLSNAKFALSVDPDNSALAERFDRIAEMRAKDIATLPTAIGYEKRTNPFMRTDDPAIRAHLGMTDASDIEVFAELRARKDRF